MKWRVVILFIVVVLAGSGTGFASPRGSEVEPTKPETEVKTKEADPAAAAQIAQPDKKWWEFPRATGDWGGTRTRWENSGWELSFRTFYQ